jgi:hypothetical protein
MAAIGREGGQVRSRELGSEGYAQLGRQGGRRVRELVEKGRQAEDDSPGPRAPVGEPATRQTPDDPTGAITR